MGFAMKIDEFRRTPRNSAEPSPSFAGQANSGARLR
jgi:hypothetical protein